MGSRPRRGVLGLRGRIVGAVLVTTVATLGVAALALLGPLGQSLRSAALKTLEHDLNRNTIASFRKLKLEYVTEIYPSYPNYAAGKAERLALEGRQTAVGNQIGASVKLLGYQNAGHASPIILPRDTDAARDPYDDVARALQGRPHPVYSFGTLGGTEYARAAIPIGPDNVLAVRKPIEDVAGAFNAVRTAFITAALAGLALTLILAIPLSATIVRRLRRLRQSALELAHGSPTVEVPEDRNRDEVGDLARTFAIMQSRLQHQEEARRAFVATASHELRTPLASLDGMLELLDDDLRGGQPDLEDARALLDSARAQSRRLGRLAADLLDLSRIDAEVKLRSEPVELGELSRAVLAEFELGTSERGIISTLDDSAGPVWVMGDPGSVARILRILLDNAVRLSPPGAELRVELHDRPHPCLSVRDMGPGVLAAERELIFERFQRGRDTGGQAGFGLGLAIGRELAERMGGELVLDDPEGPGACFRLRLPAARAPDHDPVGVYP